MSRSKEWVYTSAKALHLLGGRAHSDLIVQKCAELGEQNDQQDIAATVRDALQRYSADSAKGRKKGIERGSTLNVFRFDPKAHSSIFEFSSRENPILRFVIGEIDTPEVKARLRESGASKSVIGAADSESTSRLRVRAQPESPNSKVFVREHWRVWPGEGDAPSSMQVSIANLVVASAWTTDEHLAVRFSNGLRVLAPLRWFKTLTAAPPAARANFELHPGGIAWPELGLQILITDLFGGPAD